MEALLGVSISSIDLLTLLYVARLQLVLINKADAAPKLPSSQ